MSTSTRELVGETSVQEAMASFSRYQVPELQELLRRTNLLVGGVRSDLVMRVEAGLRDGTIPVDTAFDYIDELREDGEQHLLLYRLRRGQQPLLARLADWAHVEERVQALRGPILRRGDRPLVEQGLYRPRRRDALFFDTALQARQPQLVAVYRRDAPRRVLFFKWIETRSWETGNTTNDEESIQSERSTNFLRIDLDTGDAEIALQKLHPNPTRSLRDEIDLYRRLVSRLLPLDAFSPLLVEPVIRRLLTSHRASVIRWQVKWVDVGNLGGGVDPGFVRGVLKRFGNYTAVSLAADWLFDQGRKDPRRVRVNLNGRTNEVEIPRRVRPEESQVILAELRRVPPVRLRNARLQAVARDHEGWRALLHHIDSELAVEGRREVEIERVAAEVWHSEDEAVKAAQELARRFPDDYAVHYYVRCPVSGNPIANDSGPLHFQDPADIPPQLGCRHGKGMGIATHPTAGNVKAVLLARSSPHPPSLVPRIANYLEHKVGKTHLRNLIKGTSYLLFLTLYAPLIGLTTWLFLELMELFQGRSLLVLAPYSLVLLLEAGIVIVVLGKPLTDKARDVLLSLASLFDRRQTGGGERSSWDTVVHRKKQSPDPA